MGVIEFAPLLFPWFWHAQTKPKPSMKPEEMSASTPNRKTKWSQKKLSPLGTVAVFAVVILVFIGVIAVFMAPDKSTTTEKPTSNLSDETPNVTTKAEWKAKLSQHFGNVAQMGVIAGFSADKFKKLMGEPSKTQTVDQRAYWYYDCSDGTIQLELNSGALMAGLMQGKINDY
jgi:hypothetical protein